MSTFEERHLAQLKSTNTDPNDFFICKHCGATVYAKGIPTPHGCLCDPKQIEWSNKLRARTKEMRGKAFGGW